MQTQNFFDGEFLLSEAPRFFSRGQRTLVAGANRLPAGTVVGAVTATGKYAAHDESATDGTQVAKGVLYALSPGSRPYDTKVMVVERDAEVEARMLNGGSGASAAAIASLAQAGVSVRVQQNAAPTYFAGDYTPFGYSF